MKIKINWGWAIVIALVLFMTFILSMVFQMMFNDKYDHQLVSENYYKDELLFQLEVEKLDNAKKLLIDVSIKNENGNLKILFPENFEFSEIKGVAYFQYVMDKKYDFEVPIKLENNQLLVENTKLRKGTYNIKVDWKYQNVSYLFKEKIIY